MRVAIRLLGAPTKGVGAFLPTLTPPPSASSAGVTQSRITGYPSTRPVPSPRPPALSDEQLGGPANQPSDVSPNYITPPIYFVRPQPVVKGWASTNELPLRCPDVVRLPGNVTLRVRVGGQTATAWPRPFVSFPTYGGGVS